MPSPKDFKAYNDWYAVNKFAEKKGRMEGRLEGRLEGIQEGRMEGRMEVAKAMKERGMPVADIATLTGLTAEAISQLRNILASNITDRKPGQQIPNKTGLGNLLMINPLNPQIHTTIPFQKIPKG